MSLGDATHTPSWLSLDGCRRTISDPTPLEPTTQPSHGPLATSPFSTVTAAFYHHVHTSPHAIAARDLSRRSDQDGVITYLQLGKRVQHLAHRLRALDVGPGDRVPLVVKRGVDMLVSLLAVLSCGAQYVPLDGGVVPDSTLRHVLEQSGGRVAVCLASTEYRISALSLSQPCRTVVVDDTTDNRSLEGDDLDFAKVLDLAAPDMGCYVIYTSGML